MGLIRRSFDYLDINMFKYLHKSIVRSRLEYAVPVWSPYKKEDIREIESVQRRATKLIPNLKNLEYEDRLRKFDLPSLVFRRLRGDMIEVFKILNGIYDPEVAPQLQLAEDDKNLRGHKWKLKKQRVEKLDLRKYFFSQSSRTQEQPARESG